MDIDILNEFLLLSGANSFAAAAKELGCSPAALRARISAFEETLGVPLFTRSPQGYELTDAGRKLIPTARAIVHRYQESVEKGRATAYKEYHRLNIAFSGYEMPLPLLERLSAFCDKYPEVHVHLMSDSEFSLREDLLSHAIDLYIAYADKEPLFDEFNVLPLWRATPHIIIPQSHPMSAREDALLKDFDGECLILYPRTKDTGLREWQMHVRDESGISYFNYRNDCSKEYGKYLLSLGKGLMIYPCDGGTLPPNTVALPLTDPHIRKLSAYGVYAKDPPNPMLQLFLNEWREHAAAEQEV